jgi:hypothetical protein
MQTAQGLKNFRSELYAEVQKFCKPLSFTTKPSELIEEKLIVRIIVEATFENLQN